MAGDGEPADAAADRRDLIDREDDASRARELEGERGRAPLLRTGRPDPGP
jgi:hypothetical protein